MAASKSENSPFFKSILKDYQLIILALPAIVYLFIFNYVPMYGMQIAFKEFNPGLGIQGSPWTGFDNFTRFFSSYQFDRVLTNTVTLSLMQLILGFPAPIILALLLNQIPSMKYKKIVQTVTYAPHFISIVVLVGMLNLFLSPNSGMFNNFLTAIGKEPVFFLGEARHFRMIYVLSGIWQSAGWSSIIYLASLGSIDPALYEAGKIDGCSRFGLIRHVDIPSIIPTTVILLLLNAGRLMNVGFQKAYLMQNPLNLKEAEIISTYVYKIGLIDAQFSYSTAIGLFNSIVNMVLLVIVNYLSKRLSETSLW